MIKRNESFVFIPGGIYSIAMEREDIDRLWDDALNHGVKKEFLYASSPAHDAEVRSVHVAKRLVTLAEFGRFVSESGYLTEGESAGWGWVSREGRWRKKEGVCWKRPFGAPADERYAADGFAPVMQVSWNDAAAYCRWLSSVHGGSIRLPLEREWEVFARVSGVPAFGDPFPGTPPVTDPESFLDAVFAAAGGEFFPPGLLWEWVDDWYSAYPGGDDHRDFGTVYKVLRGGSAMSIQVQRSRTFRLRKCPTARSPYYGIRIALAGEFT